MEKGYNEIKMMFDALDNIDKRKIQEAMDKDDQSTDGISYTQNDEIMTNSLETCKTQFGADFTKHNDPSPMIYYPSDGDVVLSGAVPGLNNAKFQFRYKDPSGDGCYIWADGLQLTDSNLRIVEKIRDAFLNWKQSLVDDGDLLDKLNKEANKD